jgi:hypothetical protein
MIDRIAGLFEAAHDERGDLGIIFDDEDAHGGRFEAGAERVEREDGETAKPLMHADGLRPMGRKNS